MPTGPPPPPEAELASTSSIEFEYLLANLSATFINVRPEEVDARIAAAADQLVRFLDFDRTTVLQFDDAGGLRILHTWARPGVTPFQTEDFSIGFPWYTSQLRAGNVMLFRRLPDDLPAEAVAERQHVLDTGLKSVLTIPIGVGGRMAGAVSFGALQRYLDISEALVQRIRLIGEIFANAMERARTETKLREALVEIQELRDRLQAENLILREEITHSHGFEEVVGESSALRRVLAQVEQVAGTDSTVLISGETGTGKELIARSIHDRGKRRDKSFVAVNCGALPAALIESELFGHEKGAFTGALARKIGRFEVANGGTIFLDEVGELAVELQPKLLRVLQEGEFERVGSSRTQKVDVRVIAATNRDLPAAVAKGTFRADLYYRLGVFPIHMPALRERREDIPLLTWFFVNRKQAKLDRRIEKVPRPVMNSLISYGWPGNVRELENVVERAMILSRGPVLQVDEMLSSPSSEEADNAGSLQSMERSHIARVLGECAWKINGPGNAADRLGLNPSTLRFRMKKLGIERPSGGNPRA
jgi:transcriptional regulator with GAF, ATPase, and Fis domain